jgi:hypothetical protein
VIAKIARIGKIAGIDDWPSGEQIINRGNCELENY